MSGNVVPRTPGANGDYPRKMPNLSFAGHRCEHCGEPLRARKKEHKDFRRRKLHVKCWKALQY